METRYAKNFGAVELVGTLPILSRSKRTCARLKKAVGKEHGEAAVEMLKCAHLEGDLGAEIHDFLLDEISNAARVIWSGLIFDPEDENNVDRHFAVDISEYEGIYFVWASEYANQGYFLSRKAADSFVHLNWDHVRQVRRRRAR